MLPSKIIEELAKRPREEIEADLERVRRARARLTDEENFLRAIMGLIGKEPENDGPPAPAEAGRKAPAREHILAVMRPRGFEPWTIARVIEAVQERDPDAKAPAIRLALRRLDEDGTLMRDQNRNYRLNPQENRGLAAGSFVINAEGRGHEDT
jgi:hypothetical protein